VVVGVNRYEAEDDDAPPILKIEPDLEARQIERVQSLRGRRDAAAAEAALAELKRAAGRDDVNLMPPIIEAARADVTMGEMCDAFREVWGTWRERPVF
jgi:methylmalonyl-CoA mutase N-terminal domain/subunit